MRGYRAVLDVLRYWRSFGWSPSSWGWLVGLVSAASLYLLGFWATPIIVLVLALFAYLTGGTQERQIGQADAERRQWSRIEGRRSPPR